MSRPFRFTFMKTSPSHRIRLKVRANARPLNANEAIRGSPSPWNVLIRMATQAAESVKRLHASGPDKVVVMAVQKTDIFLFPRCCSNYRPKIIVGRHKRDSRSQLTLLRVKDFN